MLPVSGVTTEGRGESGSLSSFSSRRRGTHLVLAVALGVALPRMAGAQTPSPPPPRLPFQDQLDLQANANVIQGSGARAFGMGGAFLARADDATAASWNPAGLSYLRRPEISFVMADSDFSAVSHDTGDALFRSDNHHGRAPDFVAFTYPFSFGSTTGAVQVSYQRVVSFDADRTIVDPVPASDSGPAQALVRQIRSRGGFDVVAFGSGWQVSRRLRFGLTVNRWIDGYRQTLEVKRSVPTRQTTQFDFKGWNAHLGVMWSPFEALNVGAVLKTGFAADVALLRSRVDTFATTAEPLDTTNAYGRDDLTLTFPGAIGIGTSWRPRPNITISLDYTKTRWSSGYIYNFFTLPKTELDEPPPVPKAPSDFFPALQYPSLDAPKQKDTSQLRAGAEYVVIREKVKLPIRVGFFTDDQYFTAEGGPPRFKGVTFGLGLILGPVLLDAAYVRETGSYTSLETSGGGKIPVQNDVRLRQLLFSIIYRYPK
jgi:long-chain fatty acid transport protein